MADIVYPPALHSTHESKTVSATLTVRVFLGSTAFRLQPAGAKMINFRS